MTLRLAKLTEIAELNPRLAAPLQADARVSFVPMSSITAETANVTNGEERTFSEVSKGYTPFLNGDVLIAKITPCFENGKIAQASLSHHVGFGSTEFHVVRARKGKADARYLLHYLRQERIRLDGERKMTGSAGQRRVPEHFLAGLEILLPALADQRRIAAILDKVDELRAKRRTALRQIDILIQSIFIDLFGDPRTNPKRFPSGNIEVAVKNPKKDIRCGPFGTQLKVHELVQSGVPLLGIENVLDVGFRSETTKYLTVRKAEELRAFDVMAGDVLVTRMGTIGRSCVVPHSFSGGRFSYHLFRIRPDESKCIPGFLAATISKSGVFQSQLRAHAHGAIMAGLNTTDLKAVQFLIPPLTLQREFVSRVAAAEKFRVAQRASLAEMDALFASLQYRAFRGEL